jgi:16S rRNA (guanine966-N2)-methyltransferase
MKKQSTKTQTIRIIGGKWRGRKISFPEVGDLRPTLGRTRETLFNWLRPEIHTTRCLDLFAGSGSLGIEALSQGAREVTMVENEAAAFRSLEQNTSALETSCALVVKTDALAYLKALEESFDIIFLDPPYNQPKLLEACIEVIAQRKLAQKYVYVESDRAEIIEELAQKNGFNIDKRTSGGNTFSVLLVEKNLVS